MTTRRRPHDQQKRLAMATAEAVRWLLTRHGDATEATGARLLRHVVDALEPFEKQAREARSNMEKTL